MKCTIYVGISCMSLSGMFLSLVNVFLHKKQQYQTGYYL